MKRIVVSIFMTICLALMMVGCGDKNNSATAPTNTPETTAKPAGGDNASASPGTSSGDTMDDKGTDNDDKDGGLSDDIKNGADDVGDGVKDAVDGAVDGAEDAVDGAVDGAKDIVGE